MADILAREGALLYYVHAGSVYYANVADDPTIVRYRGYYKYRYCDLRQWATSSAARRIASGVVRPKALAPESLRAIARGVEVW